MVYYWTEYSPHFACEVVLTLVSSDLNSELHDIFVALIPIKLKSISYQSNVPEAHLCTQWQALKNALKCNYLYSWITTPINWKVNVCLLETIGMCHNLLRSDFSFEPFLKSWKCIPPFKIIAGEKTRWQVPRWWLLSDASIFFTMHMLKTAVLYVKLPTVACAVWLYTGFVGCILIISCFWDATE